MRGTLALLSAAALGGALMAAGACADPLETAIGEKLFRRHWVSAPASTRSADGLGPLFAATSCAACHPGGGAGTVRVIRLQNGAGGDPVYGHQIQPFAVAGIPPEAVSAIDGGGDRPTVSLTALAYGPLDPATRIGLRRPLPLDGLGAADRLGDDAILANEGIAGGRARRLTDGRLGRFGWKASSATIEDQIAAAFSADLGMSTPAHPDPFGDCTPAQTRCRSAATGSEHGEPEVAEAILAAIAAYVASLSAQPAHPGSAGADAFAALGCAACHRPALKDAQGRTAMLYSDLLLHEMGPALDDGVAEPGLSSSEWRTPPLLGLARRLDAGAGLLHDGRAMTIEAAIAAHGGTADAARAAFESAPASDRAALISFLKGL
jgi:CxxC motif-containing protein (DUF1111 family)